MAIAFKFGAVSADTNDGAATSIASQAGAGTIDVGDAVTGFVFFFNAGRTAADFTSVSDGSNTYTLSGSGSDGFGGSWMHFSGIATAQVVNPVITGNLANANTFRRIAFIVESGANSIHKVGASINITTPTNAADAVASVAVVPTVDGCRIIGFSHDTNSVTAPTAGTGFTSRLTASYSAVDAFRFEDNDQTTAASVTATLTSGGSGDQQSAGVFALDPIVLPPTIVVPVFGVVVTYDIRIDDDAIGPYSMLSTKNWF